MKVVDRYFCVEGDRVGSLAQSIRRACIDSTVAVRSIDVVIK